MQEIIEVSSCYIRMSIELFTTEIYANWVRKEELERWFREYYSQTSIQFCIVSNASGPQHPNINSSHSLES